MAKKLVLAEKPSVARDIAKVLNCSKKGNGYLEGTKYIITWALGHLVTLAQPEIYDSKLKTWKIEDIPMLPEHMKLVVIKNTSKQFNTVKGLMSRKDVDEIIIATDAGREGELVARWIIDKARIKKPIKRLWISSQTDKAIREGFNSLKPGNQYYNLYKSAVSRAEADWLVGLNVTRALTCKYNAQLSAGRVQTPTLAMIVKREEEIKGFTPKPYWTISAKVQGFKMYWRDANNNSRIFDIDLANNIVEKIQNQNAKIVEVKKANKKEPAPLLYDLTELQRDANKRYGFSPKKTLSLMQALYERHKIVTYPRTDSRHITDDIVPTLKDRLKSISVGPYTKIAAKAIKEGIKVNKRIVDNSKVTDHHAIIPTEQYVDLNALSSDERKIYDLIILRFTSVFYKPYEYEKVSIIAKINDNSFFANGKRVLSKGWKEVYDYDTEDEDKTQDFYNNNQQLPDVEVNTFLKVLKAEKIENKTKPPARYTEATLLSAMENPDKYIQNKELKNTMKKTSGLGTPATRADIIEKLFNAFYIEKRGREIHPTSKGIQLIELVPNDLRLPELTAKWEQQLKGISDGKVKKDDFIKSMKEYVVYLVKDVKNSNAKYKHNNLVSEKCPVCGKPLLEVNGKKGKMYVCQDRECGFRKSISQNTNARCPNCHKKLTLYGEGEGKIFVCQCGYREKLSAFKKRKESQAPKVNKKEINKYLKKQDNKEPINSALADALAKWKKE